MWLLAGVRGRVPNCKRWPHIPSGLREACQAQFGEKEALIPLIPEDPLLLARLPPVALGGERRGVGRISARHVRPNGRRLRGPVLTAHTSSASYAHDSCFDVSIPCIHATAVARRA